MDGIDLTAQFIVNTRWNDLPETVQEKSFMCLIDNVSAAISGTLTKVSEITADYAEVIWPGDQATLLMRSKKTSVVGAAFANAWAANGFDTDDGIQYAYGHAGAQLFPVSLAIAEARKMSGVQLLTSLVVGYEVSHRVGRCWHDDHEIYQACGSWGSVGSAASAAHLMGLSEEQAWHALGIAEYHAPNLPMMRDIDHPAMVKHGIGWGAMTGVISAELAERGFTGIPSILCAEKYQDWVNDIGEHYIMVDGVAWKAKNYACCGWSHAAAEGAKQLIDEYQFNPDDIARIDVEGPNASVRLGSKLPTSTEAAQFNMAWPIASMLIDGEIGPDQTLEKRLDDPRMREVASKVTVTEAEDLNELLRLIEKGDPEGSFSSRVQIHLKDGSEFKTERMDIENMYPPSSWTKARMEEKFRWLASFVLDDARTDTVLDMLWHFDTVADVRDLTILL
jgi:2-methylcitrate dehydratase PrpD